MFKKTNSNLVWCCCQPTSRTGANTFTDAESGDETVTDEQTGTTLIADDSV